MNSSLVRKITLGTAAVVAIALITSGVGAAYLLGEHLREQTRSTATTVLSQTAATAAKLALSNDLLGMNLLLSRLVEDPSIRSAQVFGVDNRLLAQAGPSPEIRPGTAIGTTEQRPESGARVFLAPIAYEDVVAGHLRMTWDTRPGDEAMRRALTAYAILATVMVLLCTGLAWSFARRLTRTLQRTHEALDVSQQASAADSDELRRLASRVDELLDQYAGESDVTEPDDEQQSGPHKHARDCSLLVIEPVDLHGLMEKFEPEQVNRALRRGHEQIRQCAALYAGELCRIEHNRALVLFTDREGQEAREFRATCCAQLFSMLMERLRQQKTERGTPPVTFRAVIQNGQVCVPPGGLAGTPPDELDPATRSLIHVAARLLHLGTTGETLLDSGVVCAAEISERVETGEPRRGQTRESARPVLLYPVTALSPAYQILLERQTENLLYSRAL